MTRSETTRHSEAIEGEDTSTGTPPVMQRSVSQLLFHYLPDRTVDWENGLAIVTLTQPRLAHPVWSEEKANMLLDEINSLLERWRKKGGSIDPRFPNPKTQRGSFAIGTPESIEARVLETALICQNCFLLSFVKFSRVARPDAEMPVCPECRKHTLRQLGQVFVHGCGELVPIKEWMPATKAAPDGSLISTSHPLQCGNCKAEGRLTLTMRTERVKDMKLECRKCGTIVKDRLTARCKRCLEELTKDGSFTSADAEAEASGSVVARIAMRMARYNANATYYPQTLSILRLDRPEITRSNDPELELLRRMLPAEKRPSVDSGSGATIEQLGIKLKQAELNNDSDEIERIRKLILAAILKSDG
jgi:hypothetical protein